MKPTATTTFAPSPPASRATYRPDIDALRAIAILMVVAFHAGVPGFAGGFTGVDVFFVISGFVILRSLTDERTKTGRVSWWEFYGRRVRRLAPAGLLMIVVSLVLGMLVFNPIGEQQAVAKGAIAAATSTSNLYLSMFTGDYFTPSYQPTVFIHTWSLSVEEQFYLGVPLLFLVAGFICRRSTRDRRRVMIALILLVCVASLASAIVLARFAPTQTFYLPFGRAYELGIGAMLAVINPTLGSTLLRRIVWWCSALVLVGVIVVGLPEYGYPGAWALIPTLAAAGMICAHVTSGDPGGRQLMSAPMLGIGKVSYGWYLWHWPLLSIIATWYLREPPVWIRVIAVLVALGIAVASYRYWEPRFRISARGSAAVRSRDGRQTVLTGLLAIAATCALALGCLVFADHRAKSDAWSAAWHAKYDTAFPGRCFHVMELQSKPQDPVCPLDGFDPARPSVVVWGDSFAQAFVPGVVKAVRGRPVNVVVASRATCPPYLSSATKLPDIPYGLERTRLGLCQQHNDAALEWILDAAKHHGPVRVILVARWPAYQGRPELYPMQAQETHNLMVNNGPLMEAGTPALLRRLDQAGVGVDLFGLSPELDRPGPECVTRRWRAFTCDVSRSAEEEYWHGTTEWFQGLRATLGDRTRVIDPLGVVCDEEVCRAQRNGIVNFIDTDHLSAPAVEMLSDQIEPTVDTLLSASPTAVPH
ncbi:acyltransferase family protein [Mycolicibacterium sp. 050158]|uniref:acyltransferase family protein n=1 Tax=Mycolicibacterium sp. 050158 TaxID=3090602 RepID=UPI00299D4A85|nr:acyltransferase family protein [Mycolicibacterium sp. 050158]MDX1892778.1 acyltransferase family protein [Mycolicibacterium sp. 050158]